MKKRTNSYFVSGMFQHRSFELHQPQAKLTQFSTTVMVSGITNETTAATIFATVQAQIEEFVTAMAGKNVNRKHIQYNNVSLIDSFNQEEEPAQP